MARVDALGELSTLSAQQLGAFRGRDAVAAGVSRKQLAALVAARVVERVLPDTYLMTAVARSREQLLRAALLWAGSDAAAAGRSAAELYGLEGVRAAAPEIVIPRRQHARARNVVVHRPERTASEMIRTLRGLRCTGVEPTIAALAATLDIEALEIACEDARRRNLTSVPALSAYLLRHGRRGRKGLGALRVLLAELDPVHPSRSTLEVKTRRLLIAHGYTDLVREFPLEWDGRVHRFDFAFPRGTTIVETNGRRWHDDPVDYDADNEKWSVPGRHGYRLVLATWAKITRHPQKFLTELAATIAGGEKFRAS